MINDMIMFGSVWLFFSIIFWIDILTTTEYFVGLGVAAFGGMLLIIGYEHYNPNQKHGGV